MSTGVEVQIVLLTALPLFLYSSHALLFTVYFFYFLVSFTFLGCEDKIQMVHRRTLRI